MGNPKKLGDFTGEFFSDVGAVVGDVLNKCQDDIRLWIVPELFLEDGLNKYQDDIRL